MTTTARPADGTVHAHGLDLHYLDWGTHGAMPLVLLHGMGGCAAEWERVAAHFAGRYHVIAIDQRGHGDSPWSPDGRYGAEQAIADLEAAVDALGLDRLVLVGHSMGGMNALAYTARHPERVVCALVNDMPPAFTPSAPAAIAPHPVFPTREAWIESRRDQSPFTPDEALRLKARVRLREVDGGFAAKHDPAVQAWEWPDLWDEARGITRPILFIRGGRSTVLSAETLMQMDMEIEPARSVTLEQSGHDTHFDMEREWLADADAFFGAHGGVR